MTLRHPRSLPDLKNVAMNVCQTQCHENSLQCSLSVSYRLFVCNAKKKNSPTLMHVEIEAIRLLNEFRKNINQLIIFVKFT